MGQRYGLDPRRPVKSVNGFTRIWIHAASVGEVQAARVLVAELLAQQEGIEFFLSTMTRQGRSVAGSQMPAGVTCFLAPLDVPVVVRRFLAAIKPDLYVCLETELWPAMFLELNRAGIPAVLLNGRMTWRSLERYRMACGLIGRLLGTLEGLAVISREDGERFQALGARADTVRVTGNIKYDYPVEDVDSMRGVHRELLAAGDRIVFVCGSTRTGEEEMLIPVFKALQKECEGGVLWVIAPRHLQRLEEVRKLLARFDLDHDLYSDLKDGERKSPVVLVDTMGDLGQLYSAGDVNFVGGSLVRKRGHNIMEAARWGRPVYYGPSIEDFLDAAEILENSGAAFRVADADALAATLVSHLRDKKIYAQACRNAAHAVSLQRGAAGRQAEMVLNLLPDGAQNQREDNS
ncbi:MAG: 3-deoxy-D-manno-octulosonic acid transferase [Desulfobulbaceae bacterium]|nr:3-deoxy-D-manno-octulosonic acid transferase [Desulfobulbaceae bacterium]